MKKEQKIILLLSVIAYGFLLYSFITQNLWVLLISIVVSAVLLICFAIAQYSDDGDIESDMLIEDYKNKLKALDEEKEKLEAKVKEKEAFVLTASTRIDKAEAEVESLKKSHEENTKKAVADAVADAEKRAREEGRAEGLKEAEENEDKLLAGLIPKAASEAGDLIDIGELCSQTIEEFESFAERAQVTLKLNKAGNDIKVKADRERLRVMFRNIIDNSIKYMNKSGSLVITISTIGSDIFVVLKDNGEGLDSSETEHIFELNFQGSNRISGNGLGLAQAKAIVDYYGGTIYAKSNQGSGMGIYVQLPSGRSDNNE